jgi:glycosyl transferase, family 25
MDTRSGKSHSVGNDDSRMTQHALAPDGVLPIDGILIINPRSFIERRHNIERQLRSLGLTYEFIHTYDACDLDPATSQRYFRDPYPTVNHQSCALKHLAAMRVVMERRWDHALILEDDVILAPDFIQGVRDAITESSAIMRPHVVYIGSGGNFYTPKSMRVPGQRLYKAQKGRFTDSYIVGFDTARLRVQWIEQNGIAGAIDCHFDASDPKLGIEWYWLEDPVVEQGSKNGTFRSAIQAAPPNIIQRFRFGWEKIRRKYIYQLWR